MVLVTTILPIKLFAGVSIVRSSVLILSCIQLIFPVGWSITSRNPLHLSQAPRPSPGPHKLRECIPLIVFLRNRLKYALTGDEVKRIVNQRLIKVDGKVRTDATYPAGFMG